MGFNDFSWARLLTNNGNGEFTAADVINANGAPTFGSDDTAQPVVMHDITGDGYNYLASTAHPDATPSRLLHDSPARRFSPLLVSSIGTMTSSLQHPTPTSSEQ